MNVDWVIPCRYVEVHDNLGTLVGAGIDTFWLPEIPAQLAVALAIRLTATAEELEPDQLHDVRNLIRGPDGGILSDLADQLTIQGTSAREDWLTGIVLNTVANFEAVEEGTYMIEFFVDHASQAIPLHVVRGPMPGA